jgi:Spy/CpxP family protein refolding chaperone
MKKSVVFLGLLMLSIWTATVLAQGRMRLGPPGPGGMMMGDGPGMMLPLLLKGVGLTAEQQTRVQGVMKAHRTTLHTLFQQLQAAHEEMANKLFVPGAIQAEDLTPQVQRIAQLRDQLMQEGLKVTLEVRGVLTAEQLTKAAEIKQRMQTLRQEMRNLLQEESSGNNAEEDVFLSHTP